MIPGGTLTVTSQNITVAGDVAINRGTWTFTAPAANGAPAMDLRGKFMEHWHKVGEQWFIAETIWNTDAPAPQPPAAAPARRR